MCKVSISEVESNSDLKQFINLPYQLYESSDHWIAPLKRQQYKLLSKLRNPFLQKNPYKLFLAKNNKGQACGSIAAIVNQQHLDRYDDQTGFFGFFECINDVELANSLISKAKDYLRSHQVTKVRGPVNPSMNHTAGLLTSGFDRSPAVFMPYNHDYYLKLLRECGFKPCMTMWAYYAHKRFLKTKQIKSSIEDIKNTAPGLSVRSVRAKHFRSEVQLIRELVNDSLSANWGFVPFDQAEFEDLALQFQQILVPDLLLILELNQRPIGFSITIPNINEVLSFNKNGRLSPLSVLSIWLRMRYGGVRSTRSVLSGVINEYHGRGFEAILGYEAIERGVALGYESCELSWILDTNKVVLNSAEAVGAVKDKQYQLLEMAL